VPGLPTGSLVLSLSSFDVSPGSSTSFFLVRDKEEMKFTRKFLLNEN